MLSCTVKKISYNFVEEDTFRLLELQKELFNMSKDSTFFELKNQPFLLAEL